MTVRPLPADSVPPRPSAQAHPGPHLALILLVLGAILALRGVSPWLLGAGAAALALVFFPDICLALFLFAGAFKADLGESLGIPADLTVILALLLIAGVFLLALRHGWRSVVPPSTPVLRFALLVAVLAAGLLRSEPNACGTDKVLRFVTLTALAFGAAATLLRDRVSRRRFTMTIVALGLAMAAFGTVTGEGLRAFGATHIATGRVIGFGLLGIGCFAAGTRFRPGLTALLIAGGSFLLFGLCYSGSRGALMALVASLAATAALLLRRRRGRIWLGAGLAGLVLMAGGAAAFAPGALRLMNERLRNVSLVEPYEGAARPRLDRARVALEIFAAHPVTGAGPGTYSLELGRADGPRGDYPHNIVLEFGAETGLIGVAAFLLLFLPALSAVAGRVRRAPDRAALADALFTFAVLGYSFANAMFSGDINDNRALFAAIGLGAALTA